MFFHIPLKFKHFVRGGGNYAPETPLQGGKKMEIEGGTTNVFREKWGYRQLGNRSGSGYIPPSWHCISGGEGIGHRRE
jgi:hypothetical protein